LVVVSPHYDDAIFSCGHLLSIVPGSTVLTVYTALPQDTDLLTDWDNRCGFQSAGDAMRARATENRKALAAVHAKGEDLGFLDSQYARPSETNADLLGDSLGAALVRLQPATVFSPLGLFHEDHLRVSDALMMICHRFPEIRWYAYEDIPYRKQSRLVRQRLARLAEQGVCAAPVPAGGAAAGKAVAVRAYRSQFRGLGYEDERPILQHVEQYWRIHRNMELL